MSHIVKNRWKNFLSLSREWTTYHTSEPIIRMKDLNGHVGRNIDEFHGAFGRLSIGEGNQEEGMPLEFCNTKHL